MISGLGLLFLTLIAIDVVIKIKADRILKLIRTNTKINTSSLIFECVASSISYNNVHLNLYYST